MTSYDLLNQFSPPGRSSSSCGSKSDSKKSHKKAKKCHTPTSSSSTPLNHPLSPPPLLNINSHHHQNLSQQRGKHNYITQFVEIVEQECISIESVTLNNRNANVHVVVKNTSFSLKIRSLDMNIINFANSHVKVNLYYANDPMKEVSFIHTPPIQYVGSSCNNGEMFSMDVKISILSSQHQGNLFYLMMNINDAKSSYPQPHIYLSHPIRVVSKVDHIKKDVNGACEKKQTFIDILTERLNKIESLQASQEHLVGQMYKQRGLPAPPAIISSLPLHDDDDNSDDSPSTPRPSNKNIAENFLEAFNRVIKVYKEECEIHQTKSLNVQPIVDSLDNDEKAILSDLLDSFTFDDPNIHKQQQLKQHQLQQQQQQQQLLIQACEQQHQHQQTPQSSQLGSTQLSGAGSSSTMSSFHLSSINHHDDDCTSSVPGTSTPFGRKHASDQLLFISPMMMGVQSPMHLSSPLLADFSHVVGGGCNSTIHSPLSFKPLKSPKFHNIIDDKCNTNNSNSNNNNNNTPNDIIDEL
ncbi:putative transcriptional regulator [Cavenderia fasciculata]|uniref:Transcriptional regulator n=1 Tax=Cavenderia fasciculata TaxID=261658 RepID=F4Q488_CACFS|nr:putative transcriptional regulator [Cavenderia fasciculata]EGG17790.1 putative transcriptional regulator [Cavenderia fasciculata]|eukprot:XP_004356274.1 putative transcriptional regulator [Cavenderia fasciculata]